MAESTHSELNALGELIHNRTKTQAAQKPFASSLLGKMRSLQENRSLRARASRFILTIGDINLTDWDLCTRLNLRANTIPQLVDDMGRNGSMKTAVLNLTTGAWLEGIFRTRALIHAVLTLLLKKSSLHRECLTSATSRLSSTLSHAI